MHTHFRVLLKNPYFALALIFIALTAVSYGLESAQGRLPGSAVGESIAPDSVTPPQCVIDFSHRFGHSLASGADLDGYGHDDFLVGAPSFEFGKCQQGKVFIFSGDNQCLLHVIECPEEDSIAAFGQSVDFACDQNGDGLRDIVVGAPHARPGGLLNAGKVYVYSGADFSLLHEFQGTVAGQLFGFSVACILDCSASGYIIVGSPGTSNGMGTAYIYKGSIWTQHGSPIVGEDAGDSLGYSLSYAGHIDADGKPGVLVGAPYWDGTILPNAGEVRVLKITTAGWEQAFPHLPFRGGQSNELYGFSMSYGDFEGFGGDDFAIGSPGWDSDRGRVLVYHGGTGSLYVPGQIIGTAPLSLFGAAVRGAREICNIVDRYEILVGAPGFGQTGGNGNGKAYAYSWLGTAEGFALCAESDTGTYQDNLGFTVAGLEDVDGDGKNDILVGAPQMNCRTLDKEGRVLGYAGNAVPSRKLFQVFPSPRITITEPDPGDEWNCCDTIRWSVPGCYNASTIKVEHSFDGGTSWLIDGLVDGSVRKLAWRPALPGNWTVRFRLTSYPGCYQTESGSIVIHYCQPGDANGDGVINISDAVRIICYIFTPGCMLPTPYAICSGDANCDCAVNISDAVYLVAYIFAGGHAPCTCEDWASSSKCGLPIRK
jgi:hypothetical protein